MNNKYLVVRIIAVLLTILVTTQTKAQLVINEVSQGNISSGEYVELLVIGSNSCASSSFDLRGWIIDDNNGFHKPGNGTGIASGCMRFKNIPFWQNIKVGTLILIFDNGGTNTFTPDLITTDNNCKLIIPISNTTLIEKNTSIPSIASTAYITTGFGSTGTWSVLGMRDAGDSFQTINPDTLTKSYHSVSWGNNDLNQQIFFPSDMSRKVISMKNTVNNNPFNQLNWQVDTVVGNETPGMPNNAQNAAWINTLNNNCQPITGTTLTIASSPSASSYCLGDTVTLTSSIAHSNVWSTGDTTQSIIITNNANINLTNVGACNPVSKSLIFESTGAAFVADTMQGIAPLTVHFTNNSQANAVNFEWVFGDGTIYNDSISPIYIFNSAGVYKVILTAINANGCKDTAVRTITVLAKPDSANVFEIPNVFTPNNDLVNDVFLVKNNNVKSFSGLIFDRWGLKVHNWTNINEGWDGRTPSGKPVTDGVYFYIMDVTFRDGSSINPTGTITISK